MALLIPCSVVCKFVGHARKNGAKWGFFIEGE